MLAQLGDEITGWSDAVMSVMSTGDDPKLEIQRRHHADGRVAWNLIVRAGSLKIKLSADRNNLPVMRVVLALFLTDLVHDLQLDVPEVCCNADMIRMVVTGLSMASGRALC